MDPESAEKLAATLKGQQVGGWEVGGYLNCGWSAFVCEASQDEAVAAIKIYDSELIKKFGEDVQTKRIERQLVLVGKEHPNLVKIYEGGKCKKHGLFYLVMELVSKKTLDKVISTIPRDRIGPILCQVASAAKFLEGLGLAHRDIKPSNIAITEDFKLATLLDLGVIRPLMDDKIIDATKTKEFLGTLRYSAPEYVLRREEDSVEGWRAVTFYQLGAVLHDMIMRYPLFQEESEPDARLVRAVCDDFPRIQANDVTTELVQLAKLCLMKNPKLRIQHISWDDFSLPLYVGSDIDAAKSRIKWRRKLASTQKEDIAEQEQRKVSQFVYDIAECVRCAVREACVGSEFFPPVKVEEPCDMRGSVYVLTVNMEPSEEHALEIPLKIYVSIDILDVQSRLLRVEGAALLGNSGTAHKDPDVTADFFEGIFDKRAISVAIDRLVHIAMDEAQRRCEEVQGEGTSKNDGKPSEWIIPNLTNNRRHK